jgi:hypothetical protein
VFGDKLEQALKIVAILPGAGTPYNRSPFSVEVLTLGGLVRYIVFFVMKLKSRTVEIAGSRVSRTRRGWRSSRGT